MNFNFAQWNPADWNHRYGGLEVNDQPSLQLGPKGWLFSLAQGNSWTQFWGRDLRFMLADGASSYSLFPVPRQQSMDIIFEGPGISRDGLKQQIPPNIYAILCLGYERTCTQGEIDCCVKVIETFWALQILKESIAKGLLNLEADVVLTPCKSLIDHCLLQPVPSPTDREALFASLLSSNLRGRCGMRDLYLAQTQKANVWWVPLFAFPEKTSSFVVQRSSAFFRMIQALPFALITENKKKERFSLFIVNTIDGVFIRLCQRKNIADLLPVLVQKAMQCILGVNQPSWEGINVESCCRIRGWSVQAQRSNREEMVADIESLQRSLRQWTLQENFCKDPRLQSWIRNSLIADPVSVQLELNGL